MTPEEKQLIRYIIRLRKMIEDLIELERRTKDYKQLGIAETIAELEFALRFPPETRLG